ncbi:nucleoside-diphosphate sugar epimerase [Mycobacteriaceae bacterium 1482268.1]|nr:nucleoside-diphosphate sugar epimerase [Mycobacteriaceae bacterium 1482268.1]
MKTILVTGATGNVGRPLVNLLVEAGVRVRAVSRHPGSAQLPAGVDVVGSAAAGIHGASAIFLNSRALGDELASVVDLAYRSGVTRLVALSAINADDDFARQPSRVRGDRNKEVEQFAIDSGLEWVSLRPTVFVSNFLGMWAPQISAGDVVSGPYAQASTAPIADADISAVAAQAFLTDDLLGQKVPLTGPQALTNAELCGVIGDVLCRPLRYQEVAPDLVRERFVALGFPTEFADAYMGLLEATVDKPALVTHEVDKILGRPAQTFGDVVAASCHLFN